MREIVWVLAFENDCQYHRKPTYVSEEIEECRSCLTCGHNVPCMVCIIPRSDALNGKKGTRCDGVLQIWQVDISHSQTWAIRPRLVIDFSLSDAPLASRWWREPWWQERAFEGHCSRGLRHPRPKDPLCMRMNIWGVGSILLAGFYVN